MLYQGRGGNRIPGTEIRVVPSVFALVARDVAEYASIRSRSNTNGSLCESSGERLRGAKGLVVGIVRSGNGVVVPGSVGRCGF